MFEKTMWDERQFINHQYKSESLSQYILHYLDREFKKGEAEWAGKAQTQMEEYKYMKAAEDYSDLLQAWKKHNLQ